MAIPQGMWDLSSPTRDGTHSPFIGSTVFTTGPPSKSLKFFWNHIGGGVLVLLSFWDCYCVLQDKGNKCIGVTGNWDFDIQKTDNGGRWKKLGSPEFELKACGRQNSKMIPIGTSLCIIAFSYAWAGPVTLMRCSSYD